MSMAHSSVAQVSMPIRSRPSCGSTEATRMSATETARETSTLQRFRASYSPRLPKALASGRFQVITDVRATPKPTDPQIRAKFPNCCEKPLLQIVDGDGKLSRETRTVGVVLSGGQAPGGHNVI